MNSNRGTGEQATALDFDKISTDSSPLLPRRRYACRGATFPHTAGPRGPSAIRKKCGARRAWAGGLTATKRCRN